jgi:hypothetical protein
LDLKIRAIPLKAHFYSWVQCKDFLVFLFLKEHGLEYDEEKRETGHFNAV